MLRSLGILTAFLASASSVQARNLDVFEISDLLETLDQCNLAAKQTMLPADQAIFCSLTFRLLVEHYGDYSKYAKARDIRQQRTEFSVF